MPRTIEQDRARAAWEAVETLPPDALAKYAPVVQGAPVAIHTAGLGQAVAFWLSRGKPEYEALLDHLAGWLLRPDGGGPDPSKRGRDLMTAIHGGSGERYRRLTAEALAYLAWLKRFAAARTPDDAPATPADA